MLRIPTVIAAAGKFLIRPPKVHTASVSNKFRLSAVVVAIAPGMFLTPTHAAPVVPGQTIAVPITPALTLFALGYDLKASKLYAVARATNGNFVFGSINQTTGVFTQISTLGFFVGIALGLEFSISASNAFTGSPPHAFIARTDGLIDVNIDLGTVSIYPVPTLEYPYAIGYDFFSKILYGRLSTGLSDITPTTGAQKGDGIYWYGGGELAIVSAVDPYHGLFFIEEKGASGATLDILNETTGVVSKVPLPAPLIGLAFDFSSGAKSAALYGVTQCCDNKLVRINTTSGQETVIATVGNSHVGFLVPLPSDINANDSFFTPSANLLVATDLTADRSWYIEWPVGESLASLNSWMTSAGKAMGIRDAGLPKGRIVHSILDFGQPWSSSAEYGTTFGQFLSTSAIGSAVISFADGWYAGLSGSTAPRLAIVVGTSNYGLDNFDAKYGSGSTNKHGKAWAAMVASIEQIIATKPYATMVNVIAGMDIEMMYSKSAAVATWAGGFGSVNYADYGDAQGCPAACANGWTASEVVTLGGSVFFPEIYSSGGGNASQWAGLSAWKKKLFGTPLNIVAPLSQLTACVQRAPTCTVNGRTDNSPPASWMHIVEAVESAVPGSAATIGPSTNIEHRVK